MLNQHALKPLSSMSGKKRRVSPTPVSSWGTNISHALDQTIGLPFSTLQSPAITPQSRPTFLFDPTTPSKTSRKTIYDQSPCSGLSTSFGVSLVLGSRDVRGKKLRGMRSRKTRVLSFGTDIKDKPMSSSMNFVDQSASPICSAGSIVTQSSSKPSTEQLLFEPLLFGLQATSTLDCGIQPKTKQL